jgi:uncharacterized BrkB/YihY/UPF0761 family membrane protein
MEREQAPAAVPPPPGLSHRLKTTVATAKEKAGQTRKRVEAARPDHPSVDVAFTTVERDTERGGGLLAGALAYRFFFWVLPFVLVLVGGLGFLSSANEQAPKDLAEQVGFVGLTARSIADASEDAEKTRVWALVIGLPALYLASIAFVKALMLSHALVWGVPNRKIEKKPMAALVMTGVLIGILLALILETRLREESSMSGLVVALLYTAVMAGLWLFVSWHLPHGEVTVWQLLPGALVVVLGVQLVHFVTVYYISRKVVSSSSAYGGLGAATAILLALFLIARVIIFGAALNAEMWRRRQEREASAQPVTEEPAQEPA